MLEATLTRDGRPYPGKKVGFELLMPRRPEGVRTRPVGSATTDAEGVARYPYGQVIQGPWIARSEALEGESYKASYDPGTEKSPDRPLCPASDEADFSFRL